MWNEITWKTVAHLGIPFGLYVTYKARRPNVSVQQRTHAVAFVVFIYMHSDQQWLVVGDLFI